MQKFMPKGGGDDERANAAASALAFAGHRWRRSALVERGVERDGRRRRRTPSWRRASKWIRCGRSRCPTTGCSARRSASRRRAGSRLDRPSRQPARRQRSRRQPESADRLVLREGAAGARVRSRRQRRRPLGRSGAKATSGPRRITASPSTTRATCGSAATAGTDAHVLKFTKAGKFLMQFGKPGQNKGSNDTENFGRPAEDLRRREGRTRRTSPTATATSASPSSTPTPASSSATGARTATSPTTRTSATTIPRYRPSSSSARRCTAPSCRTTASSTCAIARTIASRSSSRTARS